MLVLLKSELGGCLSQQLKFLILKENEKHTGLESTGLLSSPAARWTEPALDRAGAGPSRRWTEQALDRLFQGALGLPRIRFAFHRCDRLKTLYGPLGSSLKEPALVRPSELLGQVST